jgi:hypothetical protein
MIEKGREREIFLLSMSIAQTAHTPIGSNTLLSLAISGVKLLFFYAILSNIYDRGLKR